MAVTVSSFKAAYPEFTDADDALVQSNLNDASLICPFDVWGGKQDLGVALTAAQSLAQSPFARKMAVINKDGSTVYDARLLRLQRIVGGGGSIL